MAFFINLSVCNVRTFYNLTIHLEGKAQCSGNNMMLKEIFGNNKQLAQRPRTKLLIFEPPHSFEKDQQNETQLQQVRDKPHNWQTGFSELIHTFGKETTIHGINHVSNRILGWKERLFWFIVFSAALLSTIYVVVGLAARFNRKQFQTVIESTRHPVFQIPFPEVTICNKNRLNWKRLEEAQQTFLTGQHQTAEMRAHFAHIIGIFDNLTYGQFELFDALPAEPVLQQLNYVNFTNVVDFMSWRCNELIFNCTWRQVAFNCCDIFTRRRSQLGQCLAFNNVEGEEGKLMMRNDPKWPWRTGKYGPGSGLQLKIVLDEKLSFPNNTIASGITVMLVEPGTYYDVPINIFGNTRTTIAVNSVFYFFDNYTRSLHPDERQCVFEGEQRKYGFPTLIGHKYMIENCQAECQQYNLISACNCTLDLFYPPANYPICKLADLPCLSKYNYKLLHMQQPDEKEYINSNTSSDMACKCYMNCYSLTYTADVRNTELKESTENDNGKETIDLSVFYRRIILQVYRTSLVFTWVDLLVSFGGIAGLFLGCSLMSLVEVGVFFFIGVPHGICHHHQQIKQERKQNQKFKQAVRNVIKRNSFRRNDLEKF